MGEEKIGGGEGEGAEAVGEGRGGVSEMKEGKEKR